jgi:acetyl-CoA carboxylase alpha subunit
VTAEQHGQGGWIARCQLAMARLGVPSVTCVIGEGGSGGAVAIAVADRVLMQENAIYSVISPEGCAAILWRDAGEAKKAAAAFKPDARHCLELGVIDGIVPEPAGGAHKNHDEAAALLAESLKASLGEVGPLDSEERRRQRRRRFRAMGIYLE